MVRAILPLGMLTLAFASSLVASAEQASLAGPVVALQQPGVQALPPPPPLASGLVVGRVIDALTNRPIANAVVTLNAGQAIQRELTAAGLPGPTAVRRVLTDSDGQFVFRDLAEGLYMFNATAYGYMSGAYGQLRPQASAQPFVLTKGARHGDVIVRLWKEATIVGTVVDEAGEPVVGVPVSLLRQSRTTGRWAVYNNGRTDDRGVYRISGNLPGLFYVVVPNAISNVPMSLVTAHREALAANTQDGAGLTEFYRDLNTTQAAFPNVPGQQIGDAILQIHPMVSPSLPPIVRPDGTISAYPSTFHPSAITSSRATPITLTAGEERTGVDIQVRPVTMVRVSGTLLGPNGPQPNFGVRLVDAEVDVAPGGQGPYETATTTSDASGRFTFLAVPSGQFVLKADQAVRGGLGPLGQMADRPTLWAEMRVGVGATPVTGLNVNLREGTRVSGRVVFEGGAARPIPDRLASATISFNPSDGRQTPCCPPNRLDTEGAFRSPGYVPGRYFPVVSNIQGWHLKSVTAGGRDILTAPLLIEDEPIADIVVTFVDKAASIEGRVVDPSGAIDGAASLVMFPANYQAATSHGANTRVVRLARPSPQTGAFQILNVVPGEYLIVATTDAALASWQDAEVLQGLAPLAARITVAPGEQKQLRLVRVPAP